MPLESELPARRSLPNTGKQSLVQRRVLCKFFAHGACLKGGHCDFLHDWKDQANNVCTFYQKGVCSYGSRCRYDHVKVSGHQMSASSSSSNSRTNIASGSVQMTHPCVSELKPASSCPTEQSTLNRHLCYESAWKQKHEVHTHTDSMPGHYTASARLADQPICSFAAAGSCPHGERCPHIHGSVCSICEKHCLHPYRPEEREEHFKMCQQNNTRIEALKQSQEIECSVCLDRVLSKPTVTERKFGLLSECDHPFCISCIRNWRSNSPMSGIDVNSAVRACPICRKLSYFVIPSVIWYSTQEEKQEIINSYKDKLKSIDCKYFDFGNGSCPFGVSCFYRHTYKPDRNRPRPRPYRPRSNMPRHALIDEEEELMGLAAELAIEDELDEELDYLADEGSDLSLEFAEAELDEGLDYLADEVSDLSLEFAILLAHFGIGESSSDEEI